MSQSSTNFDSDRSPIQEGQLAPHNVEAEEAVLGSILLNPVALFEVIGFLNPEDFFIVRNGWVYQAMLELFDAGDPVDHLTVVSHLEIRGQLSETGGAAYIISLINKTPSAMNVEGYGHIVKRMAVRRLLIEFAQMVARLAHSDETDLAEIFDKVNKALSEIGGPLAHIFTTADVMFSGFIDDLSRRIRDATDGKPDIGRSTGLPTLDYVLGGDLREGVYNLIFGPTGVGKTWWLIQVAQFLATQVPVVYVTLETNENQIRDRAVAIHSEIPYSYIKTGMVNVTGPDGQTTKEPMDIETQTRANLSAGTLGDLMFEVVDYAVTPQEIENHLVGATIRYGRPGICIVDTLNQLADSMGKGDRYENLTRASARLLRTTRLTGWGVLAAAQQGNKLRPRMSVELAKAWAWPTRNSIEGARTISQHTRNMIGMYSPKFIADETVNPEFTDESCPGGHVLFLNVKANDNDGLGAGYLQWDERIPKYREPEKTGAKADWMEKAKAKIAEREKRGLAPVTPVKDDHDLDL